MIPALDMQRARAGAIARELVARAPADSIASIFAGGSLGRGEVWAAEIFGRLEIYSDLDLYVVLRDVAQSGVVRSIAAQLAGEAPGIDGVHFLRAPEIGVYSAEELEQQPLRPGTVDLAVHHYPLHGDAALVRGMATEARNIPPDEALYLIENRMLELEGVHGPDQGERLDLMHVLKARLDVHTAHSIVDGSFVPALRQRAERFASAPPATLDAAARDAIASAYRAAEDLSSWLRDRDLDLERESARRALSRSWRTLAPLVLGTAGESPAEVLVARRCHFGARSANAREAVRLRRYTGMSLPRAVVEAAFLSLRSPRCSLRLDALIRQFGAEGFYPPRDIESHRKYVDRLTRTFGFTDGPLEKRVLTMHRVIS